MIALQEQDWNESHGRVVDLLNRRLGKPDSCSQLIGSYESLTNSFWTFVARLLDDGGAKAVLLRASDMAASQAPLVRKVRVKEKGVEFHELLDHVVKESCSPQVLMDAVVLHW